MKTLEVRPRLCNTLCNMDGPEFQYLRRMGYDAEEIRVVVEEVVPGKVAVVNFPLQEMEFDPLAALAVSRETRRAA